MAKPKQPKASRVAKPSGTVALAAAALSAAKAIEYMAKMNCEGSVPKPSGPMTSGGGDGCGMCPPKPPCTVFSGGGPPPSKAGHKQMQPTLAQALAKAQATAKVGPTLPVQEQVPGPKSSAVSKAHSKSGVSGRGCPKATFAGRYPPSDSERRTAWYNMVDDFDRQKVENKTDGKRPITQAEWYSNFADIYGLGMRKKRAVNKKPAGSSSSSSAMPVASFASDSGPDDESVPLPPQSHLRGTEWEDALALSEEEGEEEAEQEDADADDEADDFEDVE